MRFGVRVVVGSHPKTLSSLPGYLEQTTTPCHFSGLLLVTEENIMERAVPARPSLRWTPTNICPKTTNQDMFWNHDTSWECQLPP